LCVVEVSPNLVVEVSPNLNDKRVRSHENVPETYPANREKSAWEC